MHELHRQEYLQSIGIESYIPRWKLPFAAESYLCDRATLVDQEVIPSIEINSQGQKDSINPAIDLMLSTVVEKNTVKNNTSRIGDILQQFEDKKSPTIQSFSLSVWRPVPGFLIVSARNLNAIPTELFLNNFLRFYLKQHQLILVEEVLRWPAIENNKIVLTENDARIELQTWLSVQHELQSIKNLWFFGDVYRYFTSEAISGDDCFVGSCNIKLDQANSDHSAKIFPDLSRFLLQPTLKAQLLSLV